MTLFTNLVTEDDFTQWTTEGTPTVTSITGPFGNTTAYRVTYASGSDLLKHSITVPSLTPLQFVIVMKENPSFSINISRSADLATMLSFTVLNWSSGQRPSLDVSAGTLEDVEIYDGTWWKLVFS